LKVEVELLALVGGGAAAEPKPLPLLPPKTPPLLPPKPPTLAAFAPEPKAVDLAANVLGVGAAAGADPKAAPEAVPNPVEVEVAPKALAPSDPKALAPKAPLEEPKEAELAGAGAPKDAVAPNGVLLVLAAKPEAAEAPNEAL